MEVVLQQLVNDKQIISFASQFKLPQTARGQGNGILRADFMLKVTDDAHIVVEMDGQQHFSATTWGSANIDADKKFSYVKENDAIKNKWVIAQGHSLLRIGYKTPHHEYATLVRDMVGYIKTHGERQVRFIGDEYQT